MTLKEAMAIIDKYEFKSVLTGDEEFLLLEALDFMIETTKETQWMVRLGGYHYDKRNFDLALKYYEMADELGDKWAAEGLGYIWYYGRTGETDYEKAFKYYQKAMENGNLRSMVKVADMYKNGYGVEKNEDIYVELIEEAYGYVGGAQFLHEPLPEVCTRRAKSRVEQGKISEAVWLYFVARDFLIERIAANPFFGDLNIMKWLQEDLRKVAMVSRAEYDLYDLYTLLREPTKVSFMYKGEEYFVESVREESSRKIATQHSCCDLDRGTARRIEDTGRAPSLCINFGEKWYRDIDDFFLKAVIDGERIPCRYEDLHSFKVVR